MRQIEIEWLPLNKRVVAVLAEDKNPTLCDLLWSYLPYRSIQHHALISGQHLYHFDPIGLAWTTWRRPPPTRSSTVCETRPSGSWQRCRASTSTSRTCAAPRLRARR